jgi:hypothetical protein
VISLASPVAIERVRITEHRQAAPGADEAFLDRIPCEVVVPEDQAGGTVEPRDMHAGKLGEGVMIAMLGSLHEGSLVHDPPA